jgi:hypothetical protein
MTKYSPSESLVELYDEEHKRFATIVTTRNDAPVEFPVGAVVELATSIVEKPQPRPEVVKSTPGVKK